MGNMYEDAKVWSVFVGCEFACTYCVPSFQAQAKRQKHRCKDCYYYIPHGHIERLVKVPDKPIIFVGGSSDLSFASPEYLKKIVHRIVEKNANPRRSLKWELSGNEWSRPFKNYVYYLQSKRPECFESVLDILPNNVILVTTLETDNDEGYNLISKAPVPSVRAAQFKALRWHRKVVTVEPIMDFDNAADFAQLIIGIEPEYVWIGFNSKPKPKLPEPSNDKVIELIGYIRGAGIPIKYKNLRDILLNEGD